jgi:hypothetical protein
MKALKIIRISFGLSLLAFLGAVPAFAQFEIAPDHFDSPNTEPFQQPGTKAATEIGSAIQCSGEHLSVGKPSSSRCSTEKADQGISTSTLPDSTFKPIAAKERNHGSKNVIPEKYSINSLAYLDLLIWLASPVRDNVDDVGQ